jgi:hypothetical protein
MYPTLRVPGVAGVVGVGLVGVVGVGLVGVDADSPLEQPAASIRTTTRPHHVEKR